MRFTTAAATTLLLAASAQAFQPTFAPRRQTMALRQSTVDEEVSEKRDSKKDNRLRMMKSDQFHRKGFKEVREGVEETMGKQFEAEIVKELRESNYLLERDGVKVYLAKVRLIRRKRYFFRYEISLAYSIQPFFYSL